MTIRTRLELLERLPLKEEENSINNSIAKIKEATEKREEGRKKRLAEREVGKRYGNSQGKPQLSYCSLGREVSIGEASVWQHSADSGKYSAGNWLKGMSWMQCSDSLYRHFVDFSNGNDLDLDTGLPLVDHIVCCAKILSNSFHTRKDLDDRPTSTTATNES